MLLFTASSLRYRSKQEVKAIIHLTSLGQEPLPQVSFHHKHFTDHRNSNSCLEPAKHITSITSSHHLLKMMLRKQKPIRKRSLWKTLFAGKAEASVQKRLDSWEWGVGCAEKSGWNPVPTLSNVRELALGSHLSPPNRMISTISSPWPLVFRPGVGRPFLCMNRQ